MSLQTTSTAQLLRFLNLKEKVIHEIIRRLDNAVMITSKYQRALRRVDQLENIIDNIEQECEGTK